MSTIHWTESDSPQSARWHSENGTRAPGRVVIADDRTKADDAYRMACEGTALLWRGDFPNARRLVQAMARRLDRKAERTGSDSASDVSFQTHRKARSHRARVLGMLLVQLEADRTLALRRAPDAQQACAEAYEGLPGEPMVVSLRELLGVIGAHEWRRVGVDVPALDARIHAHYGVFSPVRGEYVDLVAQAPLPGGDGSRTAFDLGTGTGVLAAVLARRGVDRVVATDISPRALACARENIKRLGYEAQVEVEESASLFPPGRATVIVCNPPWLPGKPTSSIEQGVYDPNSHMLRSFLSGLRGRLEPGGEGWLILSDLAEHLGLRTREELLAMIAAARLRVVGRLDTAPQHPKASDTTDPLHAARAAEVTSLWRLAKIEEAGGS